MKPVQIGWLAALRNIDRSGLAVAALALATIALLIGTALIPVDAQVADRSLSILFGGEILVLPYPMPQPGQPPAVRARAQLRSLAPEQLPLYVDFHPEAARAGSLMTAEHPAPVNDLLPALRGVAGVAAVHPLYVVPALLELQGRRFPVWLQARTPDDPHFGRNLVAGQELSAAEPGVLVNATSLQLQGSERGYASWAGHPYLLPGNWPRVGDVVRLLLLPGPGAALSPESAWPRVSVPVVGQYRLPLGEIDWQQLQLGRTGLVAGGGAGIRPPREPVWYAAPTLAVSWRTWQDLQRQRGDEVSPSPELIVHVNSPWLVQSVVNRLNRLGLSISAWTVHDIAASSDWQAGLVASVPRLQADIAREVPPSNIQPIGTPINHSLPPLLLGGVLAAFYAMASLLLFAHVRLLLAARGEELAVLRALGYSRGAVLTVLMTELAGVAVVAVTIGYVASLPFLVFKWGPERIGWSASFLTLLKVLGLGLAVGLGVTGLLAIPPALIRLRQPVREVFRRA